MKLLSFIVAMLVMLPSEIDGKGGYWDTLLDKYEALCNACLEKKSKKEIQRLSGCINEMLKHPEGKMTPAQKHRFANIQNKYRGFITISNKGFPEIEVPRLAKVDTIRKYEHIQVTDTVFVKEIIGSIELNQFIRNKDTVYHIIQYQNPFISEISKENSPLPEVTTTDTIPSSDKILQKPEQIKDKNLTVHLKYFILGNVGIGSAFSYGGTLGVISKWGGYVGFHSNFKNISSGYSCSSDGFSGEKRIMTNGNLTRSRFSITTGAEYEVQKWMIVYVGAGYGKASLFWQDIDNTWISVSDLSIAGAEFEAGGIFHLGILAFSLGVNTIQFRNVAVKAGIGFIF